MNANGRVRVVGLPIQTSLIAVLLIAPAAIILGRATGARDASCDQTVAAIQESQAFTPYGAMLSDLAEVPLNPMAAQAGPVGLIPTIGKDSLDGLPIRLSIAGPDGTVARYFLTDSIDSKMRISEFFARGGIEFDQFPLDPGAGPFAKDLLDTLGERAVPARIGSMDGALTWADPISNGVRTHNLYWADREFNYALIADRPAVATVQMAKQIVC